MNSSYGYRIMKTYDKSRFKHIMVALDVYRALKSAKQSMEDSFNDVLRRLIRFASRRDVDWSVVTPVQSSVRDFYRSELFA
jgi:predicted CopG family antitoxin